jgi:zinc transport system ATP-binding protein
MEKLLELKGVSLSLGSTQVLKDIDFSVDANDFIAIIGPNGGGKTTLLKVILGMLKPDKGEVRVMGKEPKEGRKLIGYLPQYGRFDMQFPISAMQVVMMGRYAGPFKRYVEDDRKAAENALKTVGMLEFKDRQIGGLSGGELQRVLLARALSREPKLLLLDEPTASVDQRMQKSFYELLGRLKKQSAIILVSHDVGAVSSHVGSVACMNKELVYHGPPKNMGEALAKAYKCPIELIAHGAPHRVFEKHEK